MKLATGNTPEGETFKFVNNELVVNPAALPENYPVVRTLDSFARSIVGTYADARQATHTRVHSGSQWEEPFMSKERLIGVETGSGEVEHSESVDNGTTFATCGGQNVRIYMAKPADLLVVERAIEGKEGSELVVERADVPLPKKPTRALYQPLGFISMKKGRLIAWGYEGSRARRFTEILLASHLAQSSGDAQVVSSEIGGLPEFSHRLESDKLGAAYRLWFKEKFGLDYTQLKELPA